MFMFAKMKNGLYTYGDDLSAFSFQWCGNAENDHDIERILNYRYGGVTESSKAENMEYYINPIQSIS